MASLKICWQRFLHQPTWFNFNSFIVQGIYIFTIQIECMTTYDFIVDNLKGLSIFNLLLDDIGLVYMVYVVYTGLKAKMLLIFFFFTNCEHWVKMCTSVYMLLTDFYSGIWLFFWKIIHFSLFLLDFFTLAPEWSKLFSALYFLLH